MANKEKPDTNINRINNNPPGSKKKLKEVITNSLGMKLKLVPAGSFFMGTQQDLVEKLKQKIRGWYKGRNFLSGILEYLDSELPRHRVQISKAFYIGIFEVTQSQYQEVMGKNPSFFINAGPDAPVDRVNWEEAREFCRNLTKRERVKGKLKGTEVYRLPREDEWEYACRAGSNTPLYSGTMTIKGESNCPELDKIAWYKGNSGVNYPGGIDSRTWRERSYNSDFSGTHRVGKKSPNMWGLFDMLGNVMEWCEDGYIKDYFRKTQEKGFINLPGKKYKLRILKGGCFFSPVALCRAAFRCWYPQKTRGDMFGFRVVLDLAPGNAGK
ncbi:formylglycine-generating enzyme family protein [Candidatus Riflebacteria bacterium]